MKIKACGEVKMIYDYCINADITNDRATIHKRMYILKVELLKYHEASNMHSFFCQ